MKKIAIAIVAIFAVSTMASAQLQNIGLRFGGGSAFGGELSTMWGFGGNRVEADLGWTGGSGWSYINLCGVYQWTWDITGGLGWFAGVGANLGLYSGDYSGFGLGVAGQIGLEYNFSFPLQITLDARPNFGIIGNSGFGWGAALGLRYRF